MTAHPMFRSIRRPTRRPIRRPIRRPFLREAPHLRGGRSGALLLSGMLLVATLLVGLLTGCDAGRDSTHGSAPGAAAEPPVVEARLGTVERTELPRRVELRGIVEADQTSAISARIMAQVTAVHVSAGDSVRKGQALLTIDPQAARGQLSQAQGALAQARAQLALAERNYRRFEELRKSEAASELELDQVRTGYEQAQGAVEQAEGAVAAASAVASDSTVRAPFSGQVVRRLVEVGDLATPGRPLLLLQSGSTRRLVLSVPESVLSRSALTLGDRVPLSLGVRPDLGTLQGTVVEMTPGADPLSHSFQVEIRLPTDLDGDGAEPLPTGVSGRAWLLHGAQAAVTVPRDAVLSHGGMSLVAIRLPDGTVQTRVITLGLSEGDRVEVLSGLQGGEVVLRGLRTVPPSGALVQEMGPPGTATPRVSEPEVSEPEVSDVADREGDTP